MHTTRFALCLLLALAASACGRSPADAPAAPAPASADAIPAPAPVAEQPAIPAGSPLWFTPDRLGECGPPQVATVHWNAPAGVTTVEVGVMGEGGKETLFASGGAQGEAKTGNWAVGGLEFVLRNRDGKAELGRARYPATPCPAS